MALVHENVVYAHGVEIHGVVFPAVDLRLQLAERGREVLLPLFEPFLHSTAPVAHGGLLQYLKAALRVGEFFGEYLEHRLFRLGYLGELVVCEDDAIPVVVLDLGKYLLAVGGCEVLLTRIKHFSPRIRLAEGVGDLVDVGFQGDNKRFLRQTETFHLIGRDTHDHGFACTYFVPADTAAVLLNHLHRVLLRGVELLVRELFEREAGKRLRRAVVGGTHVAVEPLVIGSHQLVAHLYRSLVEPTVETLSDLLDLGSGLLHGLLVRHAHLAAVPIHLFRQLGYGIMKGMYKEVFAVAVTNGIGVVSHRGIALQAYYIRVVHIEIHHLGFDSEKFRGEIGV